MLRVDRYRGVASCTATSVPSEDDCPQNTTSDHLLSWEQIALLELKGHLTGLSLYEPKHDSHESSVGGQQPKYGVTYQ